MNKLQQLKAKIQELVPDIMKLKFGCEVIIQDEEFENKQEIGKFIRLDDKDGKDIWADVAVNRMVLVSGWWKYKVLEGMFVKEILGRPITLEDVLRAIYLNDPDVGNHFAVMAGGNITLDEFCEVEKAVDLFRDYEEENLDNIYYNIGSPLQDQSEETIDFLHSLIVKE